MDDCGTFELTAWDDGILRLPPLLSRGLSLEPGDILFIERGERALFLRIYREFLAFHLGVIARYREEDHFSALSEILSKVPTAIDEHGELIIPPEVLKVEEGETLTLHVGQLVDGSLSMHWMVLYWPRPKEASHFIRMEIMTEHVSLN
jgi:hypothetical protein